MLYLAPSHPIPSDHKSGAVMLSGISPTPIPLLPPQTDYDV